MSIEHVIGGLYAAIGVAMLGLLVARGRRHHWSRLAFLAAQTTLILRLSARWFSQVDTLPMWLDRFTRSRTTIAVQLELLLILTLVMIVVEWGHE